MPAPFTAIPRDQAADELHCSLDQIEAEAERRGVRSFQFEGALHFSAGDLERCWLEDEGRHDEIREPSILPPEVRSGGAIIFSADAGSSTSSAASKVVTIKAAAEACGLTEDVMRERVAYRCKLKVVNGELSATQGDLSQLAEAGVIPRPSEVAKAAKQTPATDRHATDPTTEAKTARMADALAIDVGGKPAESEPSTPQQFTTVSATERPSRRLGAPRRWGQR
jgi:hypothetical protein